MDYLIWFNSLFKMLEELGEEGQASVEFLRKNETKIKFKRAKASTGAWWAI